MEIILTQRSQDPRSLMSPEPRQVWSHRYQINSLFGNSFIKSFSAAGINCRCAVLLHWVSHHISDISSQIYQRWGDMWWGQWEVDDYTFPGLEGEYLVNSQDLKSLSFLPPSSLKKIRRWDKPLVCGVFLVPMEGESLEPALRERYGKGRDGKSTSEAKKASPRRQNELEQFSVKRRQVQCRQDSVQTLRVANAHRAKKNYNKTNTLISFDIFHFQELAFPGFPKPERLYWNSTTLNGFLSVHLSKCYLNQPKLSVVTTSSSERFHTLITGLACCKKNCICTFVWTYFFHIIWW